MNPDAPLLGIRGFLIDAPEFGRLRSWSDGALIIDGGLIAEIGDYASLSRKPREQPVRWRHSPRSAVFPGLIDLHARHSAAHRPGEARAPVERKHRDGAPCGSSRPEGDRLTGSHLGNPRLEEPLMKANRESPLYDLAPCRPRVCPASCPAVRQ